jgi:Flp pilus assembly protein TadD
MDLATFHERAGDVDEARAVLARAIALYPHEFTWLHAMARLLLRVGEPAEALPFALGALAVGYGDNRLRAAETCARATHAVGHTAEAMALLDRALAEAERPPEGVEVRTLRYLAALESTRAELSAAAP